MSRNQWGRYQGLLGGRKYLASTSIFAAGAKLYHAVPTTSIVWPAANRAFYAPIVVERETVITQLWCLNGSIVAGNIDVGLYASDGTRLTSAGSTAQAGTTVIQKFNITDLFIGPGLYYLALALSDGATATVGSMTTSLTQINRVCGCAEQASAFALPATATFATMAQVYLPVFGFSTRAVL